MVQQRIKFIRDEDGGFTGTTVTEADTNTLTAQPVALDSNEDFRLIVRDDLPLKQISDSLQALKSRLDQQLITDAVVA